MSQTCKLQINSRLKRDNYIKIYIIIILKKNYKKKRFKVTDMTPSSVVNIKIVAKIYRWQTVINRKSKFKLNIFTSKPNELIKIEPSELIKSVAK